MTASMYLDPLIREAIVKRLAWLLGPQGIDKMLARSNFSGTTGDGVRLNRPQG
jgi:hypothetical protein